MIDRIEGVLVEKSITEVIITAGSIGFSISVSVNTMQNLGALGTAAKLFTYLLVRDDGMELFGFISKDERALFLKLIKVSGVGPKTAMSVLSRFTSIEFTQVISDGDTKRLATVPGIGKRTAERLVVELKDRLTIDFKAMGAMPDVTISKAGELMRALETLGYSSQIAEGIVKKVRDELGDEAPLEEMIRRALRG